MTTSAAILTFPQRADDQARADARLQRALANLVAAVDAQRVAIAAWRASLVTLGATVAGLGESWRRYDAQLGTLAGQVADVNAEARRLESWAVESGYSAMRWPGR